MIIFLDFLNSQYKSTQWTLFIFLLFIAEKTSFYILQIYSYRFLLAHTWFNFKIKYSGHTSLICKALKVVVILNGSPAGYTKVVFLFVCQWDNRGRSEHTLHTHRIAIKKRFRNWSPIRGALGAMEKVIILPLLHIKLYPKEQFVIALKHDYPSFLYLKTKFSKLSHAEIKGIFVDSSWEWIWSSIKRIGMGVLEKLQRRV